MTKKKPLKRMKRGLYALIVTVLISTAAPTYSAPERHILLDDCIVTGCNNETCTDAKSTAVEGASPCNAKPEYLCYAKLGECKHQASGQCGWTPSVALAACVANPPKEPGTVPPTPFITPQPPATPK